MKIRLAVYDDICGIMNLYKQENWYADGYDEKIIKQQGNDLFLLVAENDDNIVGTVQLNIIDTLAFGKKPYGVIEFLVVDKACRRMGIATQLFKKVDEICISHNCESVMLTSTAYRKDAHEFYKKMGYSAPVVGFRKEY